jgi:hypothetical protein
MFPLEGEYTAGSLSYCSDKLGGSKLETTSGNGIKGTVQQDFLDVDIKGKVSSRHSSLIALINQAEAKLETTSDNGIKGTVQQDFRDISI